MLLAFVESPAAKVAVAVAVGPVLAAEVPPTGPPYPPELGGRACWFSPLADWVSYQSANDVQPASMRRGRKDRTHFAIFRQVDLQSLGVVLETQRRHGEENVLAIDGLALLLLAFLRGYTARSVKNSKSDESNNSPSLVMNEINSLTHSCIHSLASLAIFALSGNAVFIILATGAKLRILASDAAACEVSLEVGRDGGEYSAMMTSLSLSTNES
jgi:hypothetical protein